MEEILVFRRIGDYLLNRQLEVQIWITAVGKWFVELYISKSFHYIGVGDSLTYWFTCVVRHLPCLKDALSGAQSCISSCVFPRMCSVEKCFDFWVIDEFPENELVELRS